MVTTNKQTTRWNYSKPVLDHWEGSLLQYCSSFPSLIYYFYGRWCFLDIPHLSTELGTCWMKIRHNYLPAATDLPCTAEQDSQSQQRNYRDIRCKYLSVFVKYFPDAALTASPPLVHHRPLPTLPSPTRPNPQERNQLPTVHLRLHPGQQPLRPQGGAQDCRGARHHSPLLGLPGVPAHF